MTWVRMSGWVCEEGLVGQGDAKERLCGEREIGENGCADRQSRGPRPLVAGEVWDRC